MIDIILCLLYCLYLCIAAETIYTSVHVYDPFSSPTVTLIIMLLMQLAFKLMYNLSDIDTHTRTHTHTLRTAGVQYMHHGLAVVLLCVPVLFADNTRYQFTPYNVIQLNSGGVSLSPLFSIAI